MLQLISVTSKATLVFRVIQAVMLLTGLLVHFGAIDMETAAMVNAWVSGPMAEHIIVGVALIASAFLPSVAGWISRDKELPEGVTVKDIEIKSGAPVPYESRAKLARQASKISLFFLMVFMGAILLGGLTACSCPRSGAVHMSMAEQKAQGLCTVSPQQGNSF